MKTKMTLTILALFASSVAMAKNPNRLFGSLTKSVKAIEEPIPYPIEPVDPIRIAKLKVTIYKQGFVRTPDGFEYTTTEVCSKIVDQPVYDFRSQGETTVFGATNEVVQCDSTLSGFGPVKIGLTGSLNLDRGTLDEATQPATDWKSYMAFLWVSQSGEQEPVYFPEHFKSSIAASRDLGLQTLMLMVGGFEFGTTNSEREEPKENFFAYVEFVDDQQAQQKAKK
jgi:hypothetical protein